MSPHSSANMGLTLSAPEICFPMLVVLKLRQVSLILCSGQRGPNLKSRENDFNWDITGTEAEILSQIRRYQKNAAVKSTAGSEQGEGDDFEASLKYQLNCLTFYITQISSTL